MDVVSNPRHMPFFGMGCETRLRPITECLQIQQKEKKNFLRFLGAKCQANNHAGKEMESKLCCSAGIRLKAVSFTTVAHLCSLPHSLSPAS